MGVISINELKLQPAALYAYPISTGMVIFRTTLKIVWLLIIGTYLFFAVILSGDETLFEWCKTIAAPSLLVLFVLHRTNAKLYWGSEPVTIHMDENEFTLTQERQPIICKNGRMRYRKKLYRMRYADISRAVWSKKRVLDFFDVYGDLSTEAYNYDADGKLSESPTFARYNIKKTCFRLIIRAEESTEVVSRLQEALRIPESKMHYIGDKTG